MDPTCRAFARLWVVVTIATAIALMAHTRHAIERYRALGIEPPAPARAVFEASDALLEGPGLLGLVGLIALGLAPAVLTPTSPSLRRWFVLSLAHVALAAVGACVALAAGLYWNSGCSCGRHDPGGYTGAGRVLEQVLRALLLACMVLALAQLEAWFAMRVQARPRPRASLAAEAGRALVMAAAPALLLGGVAGATVEATRLVEGGLVLIPVPLAAGGTVALAVWGLAVWTRLRPTDAAGGCS